MRISFDDESFSQAKTRPHLRGGRHGIRGKGESDRNRAGRRVRKAFGVFDWGGTALGTAKHVE